MINFLKSILDSGFFTVTGAIVLLIFTAILSLSDSTARVAEIFFFILLAYVGVPLLAGIPVALAEALNKNNK